MECSPQIVRRVGSGRQRHRHFPRQLGRVAAPSGVSRRVFPWHRQSRYQEPHPHGGRPPMQRSQERRPEKLHHWQQLVTLLLVALPLPPPQLRHPGYSVLVVGSRVAANVKIRHGSVKLGYRLRKARKSGERRPQRTDRTSLGRGQASGTSERLGTLRGCVRRSYQAAFRAARQGM